MLLEPLTKEAAERVQEALVTSDYKSNLQTPEEIHYFAAEYNWDSSTLAPLRWIIRHPLCDKGTAIMIYWLSVPKQLYAEYSDRSQVKKYDLERYDLVKEIEEKILSDHYTQQNLCYPTSPNHKRIRLEKYHEEYKRQRIPEEMFNFTEAELSFEGE